MRKRNPETVKSYNKDYWQKNKATLLLKQYARLRIARKLKKLNKVKKVNNLITLSDPETIRKNREALLKKAKKIRINQVRMVVGI